MNNPKEVLAESVSIASAEVVEKPGGEGGTPGSTHPVQILHAVEASAEVVEKPGGEGGTPGSHSGGPLR